MALLFFNSTLFDGHRKKQWLPYVTISFLLVLFFLTQFAYLFTLLAILNVFIAWILPCGLLLKMRSRWFLLKCFNSVENASVRAHSIL